MLVCILRRCGEVVARTVAHDEVALLKPNIAVTANPIDYTTYLAVLEISAVVCIYAAADLAVVPTRYDFDNLDTTVLFADLFVQISKAKMLFIPNCISEIELRRPEIQDARNKAKDLLEVYGDITPRIKQCVTVKCYSTIFPHDKYQRNAVKFAFEKILELID